MTGFRGVDSAIKLKGACVPGRVGIIDDRLIGHELSDDIGQLSWVREVDSVSRSVDRDEDDAVFNSLRDFADARWAGHQRIAGPGYCQCGHVQTKQPVQRRKLGERSEHPEGAGNTESQIVGYGDAQHPNRFAQPVVAELPYGSPERLIVYTASR